MKSTYYRGEVDELIKINNKTCPPIATWQENVNQLRVGLAVKLPNGKIVKQANVHNFCAWCEQFGVILSRFARYDRQRQLRFKTFYPLYHNGVSSTAKCNHQWRNLTSKDIGLECRLGRRLAEALIMRNMHHFLDVFDVRRHWPLIFRTQNGPPGYSPCLWKRSHHFLVFELGSRARQADGQRDGRAICIMRPTRLPHVRYCCGMFFRRVGGWSLWRLWLKGLQSETNLHTEVEKRL